jgi:serine/threonine protein kinase
MMADTPLPPASEQEHMLLEIMQLQLLQHRHIAFILEYGIQGQYLYLVTSYADGGSIEQRLAQTSNRVLPVQEVLLMVKQIGGALQFAHHRDIIHANLKPENILFRANGEVLLTDFRLFALTSLQARAAATRSGQRYRAPEQLQSDQHAPASDQYTLALLAWEWLFGSAPFPPEILERFARSASSAQPTLALDLPEREARLALVGPLRTALASKPTERYPSIRDFVNALFEAYAHSQPETQAVPELAPPPPAAVLMGYRSAPPHVPKLPARSAFPSLTAKLPTTDQPQQASDVSLPPKRTRRFWGSS